MKFGTHNKSNILINNILIGIDYLEPKLQICEIGFENWNALQFLWNLASEQMEVVWNGLVWDNFMKKKKKSKIGLGQLYKKNFSKIDQGQLYKKNKF